MAVATKKSFQKLISQHLQPSLSWSYKTRIIYSSSSMLMAQMRAVCLILYECYLLKKAALSNIKSTCLKTLNSEPRLLNLILLNLIVRWPSECSHYIKNLWNATFGLWKVRIMNGWMVSFEWKTSKHQENRELVTTLWFNFESFRR